MSIGNVCPLLLYIVNLMQLIDNTTLTDNPKPGVFDFVTKTDVELIDANISSLFPNISPLLPNMTIGNMYTHEEGLIGICKTIFSNMISKAVFISILGTGLATIFIGNVLVIILPVLNKFFRIPVFITVRSFSFVSLFRGLTFYFESFAYCPNIINMNFLQLKLNLCMISKFSAYIENVTCLHLCVLACQRIFMTSFPLKAQVYHTKNNIRVVLVCIYCLCVLLEIMLSFFGIRPCEFNAPSATMHIFLIQYIDLIFLNFLVSVLLITAMVASVIRLFASNKLPQTAGQKSQSRIASIIILIYTVLYCPISITATALEIQCADSEYILIINVLKTLLQVIVYSLSPFIFCLRMKVARRTLTMTFCKSRCISSRS